MSEMNAVDRAWPVLRRLMRLHTAVYRAPRGAVGHRFRGGAPKLLLDHVGAKSGKRRTKPLNYVRDGEDLVVVASKGGYPRHPGWFLPHPASEHGHHGPGRLRAPGGASAGRGLAGARATVAHGGGDVRRLPRLPGARRARDPARHPLAR